MASRMERYYSNEQRSKKNEDLYKQIGELGSYTNIEGVADISNSNEINIDKVKEMLLNREKHLNNEKNVYTEEIKSNSEKKEERNYDLKEVLDKAKVKHSDVNAKYRNLNKRQYDILRKIKIENPDDEEIDELLNTLSFGSNLDDDLGIFDELKSNTMVGEPSSIKKVLEEAKEIEESNEIEVEKVNNDADDNVDNDMNNIDRSFYTSSFNFSDKDFEDLRNLDNNIKTNNRLIKIAIIVFSVLIALVLLFLVIKGIK